jgi:hypothetical protein
MLEAKQNIVHEEAVDLSSTDFVDEEGFFFHTTAGGNIKYCAKNDTDAAAVTKTFDATDSYTRPVMARKIFKTGTTATGIYAGKAI